jgi:phosphate transport system protein
MRGPNRSSAADSAEAWDPEESVRHFDIQVQELLQRIVLMGSLAESMIQKAIGSLVARNETLAAEVFSREQEINALQVEVDDRAVKLTVLQQPVASDARFLFMASRIAGELERIGDQAVNICQNAHYVLEAPPLRPLVDLPIMADIVQKLVRDSLTAMINRDAALADQVLAEEQKVDAFRDQVFRTLLTYMMADPGTIQRALSLILIARNLERVADHATNIAEEVIYWIQGRDVRHGHALADDSAARGPLNGPEGTGQP